MFYFPVVAEPPTEELPAIPSVKTLQVKERYEGQIRKLSGRLEAAESSILSFAVSGTVNDVFVERGELVSKGQVLAKLDTRTLESQVKSARAELKPCESAAQ